MKYKIGIIGAGSIGALKPDDIDSPGSENILTHAHAIDAHQDTELIAVVDSDVDKLEKVIDKWQPKDCFNTVEQMYAILQNDYPDILVVSTPTDTHYQVLHDILKFSGTRKPKLVIAEKPFCDNSEQAKIIIDLYKENNIPICIDYIRRFSNGHQDIKSLIEAEAFGKVQNGRVLYGRGIKRDGCHAIDLLYFFFGKFINGIGLYSGGIPDRSKEDLSYNVEFNFEKCENIIFQACDSRFFGIFEIDIILEQARIRLIDNGLFYEVYPIDDRNKWGHASLNYSLTSVLRKETQLNLALYNLLDNCINHLKDNQKLLCCEQDALNVHKIYDHLGI